MPDRDKKTGRFISSAKAKTTAMTNAEFFEKNNVLFAEAMKLFNEQKSKKGGTESFDKFLASEHVEPKFKVGDIIVLQLNNYTRRHAWMHQVVFKVKAVDKGEYELEFLTPHALGGWSIGARWSFSIEFVDENCIKY